jgi:uncharacterized protein YjbI with pentapeptide repeats
MPGAETDIRSANEDAKSYSSLDALRIAHNELLESLPDDETAPPDDERRATDARINEFLRRAADSGAYLDSPADRKIAQGLIDYWVASSYAGSRERSFSRLLPDRADLVLKPFDSAKVTEAIERADGFIAAGNTTDQELAHRIVMHLVRLTGAGEPCRVAPQERDKLLSLGNVQSADRIIDKLTTIGVLRTSKTDDQDRVELSYEALTRQWPRLREWINERQAFRGSVAAWEQGKKATMDLSFNRTLLAQADAYGDLNKSELEFKQRSERLVRRSKRTLLALAAIVLLPFPAYWIFDVGQDQYVARNYRDKVWIVKRTGSTGPEKLDAINWLVHYRSRIPFPSFDFSRTNLKDMGLSGIYLVSPNFSNSTFLSVVLDRSTLRGARFPGSTITKSSFQYADLAQSTFSSAALSSTKFMGAKLNNAFFDRTRFCGGDFSGANLSGASFRGAIFDPQYPLPNFKNTAWWLAAGWGLDKADQLNQLSYEDPTKDQGFINAIKEDDANVSNSADNTLDRASALNGKAWTMAIYGVSLEQAEKLVADAITTLNGLKEKPADNKLYSANFADTLGYIRLQRGTIPQALDDLRAADASGDSEIMFRYAVALNASGSTPDAIKKLEDSVSTEKGKGNYSPSHELHLLRKYINGDFKKKLGELLDKRVTPGIQDPPECPRDEQKS